MRPFCASLALLIFSLSAIAQTEDFEKINVGINQFQIANSNTSYLETKNLVTCIGISGYHLTHPTIFLTHLLFYDGNLQKSITNAEDILLEIERALNDQGLTLLEFNLTLAGGNISNPLFSEKILDLLRELGFKNLRLRELNGNGITDMTISGKETKTRYKPTNFFIE